MLGDKRRGGRPKVLNKAAQICKEVQKPYNGKSRDDYLFFDQCPKYTFFSCLIYKMILFRGRSCSCLPGDKKA